jgi:hypothetical protein
VGDLGSHAGPVGKEERPGRQATVVSRLLEIVVEEEMRRRGLPMFDEVHAEERHVREDVNLPEVVIELDTVERQRRAAPQADVPQVEVTMTVAHLAGRCPPGQEWQEGAESEFKRGAEVIRTWATGQEPKVVLDRRCQPAGKALRDVPRGAIRSFMQMCDAHGQRLEDLPQRLSTLHDPIEAVLGAELPHADCVFLGVAGSAEAPATGCADKRDDIQVEVRSSATVEPDLGIAALTAEREGREVDEAVVHGLLELVSVVTGESHHGEVRLQYLDTPHGMGVRGWLLESG